MLFWLTLFRMPTSTFIHLAANDIISFFKNCCEYVLHPLYPVLCWWTFRLLLCLGYSKWVHNKHGGADIIFEHHFSWIYAQVWDYRSYDSSIFIWLFIFFILIGLFQLEDNYFTILWWCIPYIYMNQPWVHAHPPSWTPHSTFLPPHLLGSPRAPSLNSLIHTSKLHWSSTLYMVIYIFECMLNHPTLSNHPTLAFS